MPAVNEALVLSTCNRTELYGAGPDEGALRAALGCALVGHSRLSAPELARVAYVERGAAAVRHLMRVAASLDSALLGESEIQGQVKHAQRLAALNGSLGPILESSCRAALAAGSRARRETGIASGAVSTASAAVELARNELEGLLGRRALVIGAGRMADGVAHALRGRGLKEITVASRTDAHARALATRVGGRPIRFPVRLEELAAADVVISATAAPGHVLACAALERAVAARGHGRLVVVDMAVPRDVDPAVNVLSAVTLKDVDDLSRAVDRNLALRRREARVAERIVDAELERVLARIFASDADSLPTAA